MVDIDLSGILALQNDIGMLGRGDSQVLTNEALGSRALDCVHLRVNHQISKSRGTHTMTMSLKVNDLDSFPSLTSLPIL